MGVGAADAGIALGASVIAAESLGLGTVPLGGIRNNPKEVIALLGLPKYNFPLIGLVVGYPENDHIKNQEFLLKVLDIMKSMIQKLFKILLILTRKK